jgi:hypothetical protein
MLHIEILAAIEGLSFRFAKTMPEIPHEYAVRGPENERAYVELFEAIIRYGVFEIYEGRLKKYLYPGDGRKYWAMTTVLRDSRVLNRMRLEDDLSRLRREGQFEAVALALELDAQRRAPRSCVRSHCPTWPQHPQHD